MDLVAFVRGMQPHWCGGVIYSHSKVWVSYGIYWFTYLLSQQNNKCFLLEWLACDHGPQNHHKGHFFKKNKLSIDVWIVRIGQYLAETQLFATIWCKKKIKQLKI